MLMPQLAKKRVGYVDDVIDLITAPDPGCTLRHSRYVVLFSMLFQMLNTHLLPISRHSPAATRPRRCSHAVVGV